MADCRHPFRPEAFRAAGERMVSEELAKMEDGSIKEKLIERLDAIRNTDQRDLYF